MAPSKNTGASDSQLSVVIDATNAGVIELRVAGVVNLPELRDALAQLGQARARRGDLRCMVLDAHGVVRFGRGAVVEAARWITRNGQLFDLAVTVTRSPSLKSAAMALSACAPTLRHVVVAERSEAVALLRSRSLAMTG